MTYERAVKAIERNTIWSSKEQEEKEYTHCLRCGRKLKNEKARKIGYGVVCERKVRNENKTKRLF